MLGRCGCSRTTLHDLEAERRLQDRHGSQPPTMGRRWGNGQRKQYVSDWENWDMVPSPAAKAAGKLAPKQVFEHTGDREAANLAYKNTVRKHMADGTGGCAGASFGVAMPLIGSVTTDDAPSNWLKWHCGGTTSGVAAPSIPGVS